MGDHSQVNEPVIAVIGGGASGTLAAAHLAASGRPMRLLMVEPGQVGRGIAYATSDHRHRLNVPAGRMSAWADEPEHFVRWLRGHRHPCATAATYAARADYGSYLADVLRTVSQLPQVRLTVLAARAVALAEHHEGLLLSLDRLPSRLIDHAVLALGTGDPDHRVVPTQLRGSDLYLPDPWVPDALRQVPGNGPVLLVGTGLTMADIVATLGGRAEQVIHAVSRHGRVPLGHAAAGSAALAPPVLPDGPIQLGEARRIVIDQVRRAVGAKRDWRAGIDSLRPVTTELFQRLSPEDQHRFLTGMASRWSVARHRAEPETSQRLESARAAGSVRIHAGTIINVDVRDDHAMVGLSNGTTLRASAVINCTGRSGNLLENPLIAQLTHLGHARTGPFGIGLATDADGRVLPVPGAPALPLWTLGPPRKGQLYESTAIPEVRAQAASLARSINATLTAGHPRQAGRR
ncbi:MAG: hypothetical protein QOD82_4019 [Pseudonocardiales bacterium]|nr:hypothetical protein [Pseudonocardiales bacterium]MDT7676117.1 hypothetical protein [Pseudonocardiales bacterium]